MRLALRGALAPRISNSICPISIPHVSQLNYKLKAAGHPLVQDAVAGIRDPVVLTQLLNQISAEQSDVIGVHLAPLAIPTEARSPAKFAACEPSALCP